MAKASVVSIEYRITLELSQRETSDLYLLLGMVSGPPSSLRGDLDNIANVLEDIPNMIQLNGEYNQYCEGEVKFYE